MPAQGNFAVRLGDIPYGKIIYHLSNTNYEKAKSVLGGTTALMGNVPNLMLASGTPDDVRAYCKKLIDVAGKGGGFIMGRNSTVTMNDCVIGPNNIVTYAGGGIANDGTLTLNNATITSRLDACWRGSASSPRTRSATSWRARSARSRSIFPRWWPIRRHCNSCPRNLRAATICCRSPMTRHATC